MRKTIPILLILVSLPLCAQTPYLVKDINSSTTASPASSGAHNFFRFGSKVFFVAGTALWSTDGTEAGTAPVLEVNSIHPFSSPSRFAVVNGKLLFNALDSPHGEELWVMDGPDTGARLLADIAPGGRPSFAGDRIVYHGQMFFGADDGINGSELWITDGTSDGTRFFKDLLPGADGSFPTSFVLFQDLIFFSAGNALWKSDGTASGTVMVKQACGPSNLTVAGSKLFFTGYRPETGNEPWVSDGTESGTHLLLDIYPGSQQSLFYGMTAFGDSVLFAAIEPGFVEKVWISDGTIAGTHPVNPGFDGAVDGSSSIVVAGGTAFFSATASATGAELWKTDGTAAGTTLVRDINPGNGGSAPRGLVAAGSRLFFAASSSGTEPKLWVTDGTSAGTRQVRTTEPSPVVGLTGSATLTYLDGNIYFSGANKLNGFEPWKSDGTDAGTSMIANIAPDGPPSSDPRNLTAAGDWIYFDAWDGSGTITSLGGSPRSLWRSDGTSEGTLKLIDEPDSLSIRYTPVGRSLFFDTNGLWTTDGTPEGTTKASAFVNRFPSAPTIQFVMGDKIFATIVDSSSNVGLWATTTAPNAPAVPLGINGGVIGFAEVAGRAMIFGSATFGSSSLWISDGTPNGTHAVVPDLGEILASNPAAAGGQLYFVTRSNSSTNLKLWKSDGTFEGTAVIKTFFSNSLPGVLTAAGKSLFFISNLQLWISDGTEAGTRVLPGVLPSGGVLAAVGDSVVFPGIDPLNGTELWVSDGSSFGTHLLSDINAGALSSSPSDLTSVEGLVYFTAGDAVHGSEIWVTDGTAAGTRLVADILPGPNSSAARQYVRAGDHLFFTVNSSETGNELWALPLPPTPRLTINDIRAAEGDSGTTVARFMVTLSKAPATTVTVDYATSNGTAVAGTDYDAASGTLTFAAGETSKNVDVLVRGNVKSENNRTFFVVLRNAAGAAMAKSTGFAIIEDDDQIADVGLALDFSSFGSFKTVVKATNNGPRTATSLKLQRTVTPPDGDGLCNLCPPIGQLATGEARSAWEYGWAGFQQWVTATETAFQRDPETSNNSVGWTSNGSIAMDALYLTSGSQANIWYYGFTNLTSVSVESSDPSVLSVPSSIAILGPGNPTTFVARALSAGTATIRVSSPTTSDSNTLTVDVVPPGTKPRWRGALNVTAGIATPFDKPIIFTIVRSATAPYTGERPTGLVTITSNGQELGRAVFAPSDGDRTVPVYLPSIGANPIIVTYAGDANFLPATSTRSITVTRGDVTIIAGAERIGTTARVHVKATGSPLAAPTGTFTISENGIVLTPITLIDAGSGIFQGDITLPNVSAGPHTFVITYSGDAHYSAASQNARLVEARLRPVKH